MRPAVRPLLFAFALPEGCSGGLSALGFDQSKVPNCGPPPPVPAPSVFFAYPGAGATNVPTTIGELLFQSYGGASGIVLSANGNSVSTGPLQPAPSPYPRPLATPSPGASFPNAPYVSSAIPPLNPATIYAVAFSFQEWDGTVASCTRTATIGLGSFTTR